MIIVIGDKKSRPTEIGRNERETKFKFVNMIAKLIESDVHVKFIPIGQSMFIL